MCVKMEKYVTVLISAITGFTQGLQDFTTMAGHEPGLNPSPVVEGVKEAVQLEHIKM